MCPDRIVPVDLLLGALANDLLVNIDPESWLVRKGHVAVFIREHRQIRQIVQDPTGFIVVDIETLFLNKWVR